MKKFNQHVGAALGIISLAIIKLFSGSGSGDASTAEAGSNADFTDLFSVSSKAHASTGGDCSDGCGDSGDSCTTDSNCVVNVGGGGGDGCDDCCGDGSGGGCGPSDSFGGDGSGVP